MTIIKNLSICMLAVILISGTHTAKAYAGNKKSVIEVIQDRGVMKVGLSFFTPWVMNGSNGELVGFEPDVARKLAADMEVEVEFIPVEWPEIISELNNETFDVIIAGMSIRPSRNLLINFTDPYAYSGLTILANKAMTEDLEYYTEYDNQDITFAARRGSTPEKVIKLMFPDAKLILFEEDGAATAAVVAGDAHAMMESEPGPSNNERLYPEKLHVPFYETFQANGEGFGVRKSDPDALNFFNNWIAQQWRSGWLEEKNDYWFRGIEWEGLVQKN
ncbi:transporter substrate-binding domain-containing protein [Paracoccaceae bacterium]|nr:transporter substrate-binding domain-containing protein [Paracoccaceae bacterium]MDB3948845.1 transporter substrate-binding domain-containing protein [Paracoccaceae bacterium]